ncbi:MAG: methylmalonyl-CoA mutase family protein, partial [Planctomycetota bacterium]
MTNEQGRLPRPSFDSSGFEGWRERVERELKGADFDRALRTRLREGLELAPLYTASEASTPMGGAGRAPFVRDSRLEPDDWSQGAPWTVVSRFGDADLRAENEALLADLAGGASGLLLEFSLERAAGLEGLDEGLELSSIADLETLLEGVLLDAVEVDLDAGGAFLPAAALFMAFADARGVERSDLRVRFGADPIGCLARDGALPGSLERSFEQLATLVRACESYLERGRAITIDLGVHARAGATLVETLAAGAATLAETFRRLQAAGVEPGTVARQIGFSIDVGRETFLEIAGMRALRGLWTAVCRTAGIDDVPAPHIRACTSPRMLTERDPWTNILRASGAAFSSAVGGANAIQVACFDEPLGVPSALGRRIARNTHSILAEESGLGRVSDPAGGSHYVESLTRGLVEHAWSVAQEIERAGGMTTVLGDGSWAERVAGSRATLARDIARRKHSILGTSEFPNLDEELPTTAERVARDDTGRDETAGLAADAPLPALLAAFASGATLVGVSRDLSAGTEPCLVEPLVPWREAEALEALRDGADEGDAALA